MRKEKSILRTKKSTVTLTDLLIKEGSAALIPGGALFYELSKALLSHGRSYFADRTEYRLNEFHQSLLTGDFCEKGFKQFKEKEFDLDDYHAVLNACVQDIEDEKTRIYSQLMQSLIKKTLKPEIRRHFITSSKSLTFDDLFFLKKLYISSKFDLMTVGGPKSQVKGLLSSRDPLIGLTIEKLISRGFIDNDKSGLTFIGQQFVEFIYSTDELKPESICRESWTGITIAIVSYEFDTPSHSMVGQEIGKALRKLNIKTSLNIIKPGSWITMIYDAGVLLVGDRVIEDKYREALASFSIRKPLVRLNLNTQASDKELEKLKFIEEFTLSSERPDEIRSEINSFISKIIQ